MDMQSEKQVYFFPMHVDHLESVLAFENDLHEFPWTMGNFRDSLNAGYSGWLCIRDDELIGYGIVMIALDEAHLLNISICRPWQGKGIGSKLLKFFIDLAIERECKRMLLEVRHSNNAAQRLYEKYDFSVIGIRKNYYPARDGREDARIYERLL